MTEVVVKFKGIELKGELVVPKNAKGKDAKGTVLFAYGAGSNRFSPRENFVAGKLNKEGFATLLMDLLTPEEETIDDVTREYRFNIPLLAERLVAAVSWLKKKEYVKTHIKNNYIGLFGGSTGAAACLIAAAKLPKDVKAVVSRGGRPDLAMDYLSVVKTHVLLIVGGNDQPVIEMNQEALAEMKCEAKLEIIKGATHLFEEPGKLEKVADLAIMWFKEYLK